MIHNGVEPLDLCWYPRLNVTKDVHSVMDRATKGVFDQRLSSGWMERPEDVALSSSPRINLLRGPECRRWRCSGGFRAYQLLSRITLGSNRSHRLQANYRTPLRRLGVERFNAPLFWRTLDRSVHRTRSLVSASADLLQSAMHQSDSALARPLHAAVHGHHYRCYDKQAAERHWERLLPLSRRRLHAG